MALEGAIELANEKMADAGVLGILDLAVAELERIHAEQDSLDQAGRGASN